jgi:hypothetical protein
MPEHDNPSFVERLVRAVMQQALGGVRKSVERYVKRIIRLVAIVLASVAIAVIGIGFIAFGAAKWLSTLMPSWLAWLIVGLILFLVGTVLALAALITSRN